MSEQMMVLGFGPEPVDVERYLKLLTAMFGPLNFGIMGREVVLYYDSEQPEKALHVVNNLPKSWDASFVKFPDLVPGTKTEVYGIYKNGKWFVMSDQWVDKFQFAAVWISEDIASENAFAEHAQLITITMEAKS